VQQQTQTQVQAQPQVAPSPRGNFPWVRLVIALVIIGLLALLFAISVLSTGRDIAPIWFIIAPAFIGLIVASITVVQYFFPLSPLPEIWARTNLRPQVSHQCRFHR
jgi:FtsH-binding integral membrane protein